MSKIVEQRFSRVMRNYVDAYSTQLDTEHGSLSLDFTRHRLGDETTVLMEGVLGRHRFSRRFSKLRDEMVMRFEDNGLGTSVHWIRRNGGDLADVIVRHDGQEPCVAKVDATRPRVEGPWVDIAGNILDIQGDRNLLPLHCDQLLPVLTKDQLFTQFLFGPYEALSGGIRVSGIVRMVNTGTPVPYAKVTLRWAKDRAELAQQGWPLKNERQTMADSEGQFEFLYVHGSTIQVVAEAIIKPNKLYSGFFDEDDVAADVHEDVWISIAPNPVHDAFAVCDIIFDGDIGGLADCYVWMIIYGP